jgi:hypothetical protein
MALGNTSASLDSILKELYSPDAIVNTLFTKNKFMAMVPKNESSDGREYVHPINVGSGQARSATYSAVTTAEALTGELPFVFKVPLNENFANASVSSKIIAQSGSNKGAFVKAVAFIADNELVNFGNDVAISMYRTSDGNRGQIGSISTPSGGVTNSRVTMKVTKDILNFEVGMTIIAATAPSGGSLRTGTAYICAVDYVGGTFDVGTTPTPSATRVDITTQITSVQATDYLFVSGDRGLKMNGFKDWIPYGGVAVTDSFLSVNRSSSPQRLAGNWLDGTSGNSLVSTLMAGIEQVGEIGGELSHYFCPFKQFKKLADELGSKVQLVDVSVDGKFGFEGIQIVGSTGPVVVLPDRTCPADTIAGVNLDTWELLSVGKAVKVWDMDGKVWLRTPSDSGMEIRFYSFCNLLCKDPRQNINIKVTP